MKITKAQLKKILLEDMGQTDSALLAAIGNLTQKIDNLDVSIDYLAGAVTGESPASLGYAQSALGRFAKTIKPRSRASMNDPDRMNEIVDAIVQELGTVPGRVYQSGELAAQNKKIQDDIEEILGPYIRQMLQMQDPSTIAKTIESAVRELLFHPGSINEENNPWAICTASVGREDKEKYEKCVKSVKKQNGE